ncbi:Pheromone-regulated membrane protein 10 [Seminavis robusta]|uniref:Pheromone-regulated membrane protein 10 n=1 Tax=Seminavis robusta TaxID=568900 RepID=A0A9N8H4F6_9STRA|nr:Pheromone-regulated membrane protein 10 [Seminavis robusta]|eukprot:Sro48_g028300.1 Pheromone-regulated membrane protein 10 (691) ;mRNA; r:88198-90534
MASLLNTPPSYQSCELRPTGYEEEKSQKNQVYFNGEVPIEATKNSSDAEAELHETASVGCSSDRSESSKEGRFYNWRLYFPATKNLWHYLRWLVVGGSFFADPQSDEDMNESLAGLARCLILLRRYLEIFGMPEKGGIRDQEFVLREIVRDLYAGGAPLWSLAPVMQKTAEGLTGQPHVNWMLFPRKAFVYSPAAGTTSMFQIDRGFNIRKMDAMEKVAVRLATFASNVEAVSNVPARFPHPRQFLRAARGESVRSFGLTEDPLVLARKILRLASKNQGLFYYVNSREYGGNNQISLDEDDDGLAAAPQRPNMLKDFWVVTEEERELFSRLACMEAMRKMDVIDKEEEDPSNKTNPWLIVAYRVFASAGACAFWFNGSWFDMMVAGFLAVLVASIGTSSVLSKQERLIYEVIASFVVGLSAGLIALIWPDHTCFASMAVAGVLDLLQGFRVIFSIIELMSKHTVAGGADLLEGILFTGLIAYFLRFGQYMAASIMGDPENIKFEACTHGIDQLWYLLFVPLAALSWSGLFNPLPRDLLPMALHGVLAYGTNYGLSKVGASNELNNFVSASLVSFSAGLVSRFTGRQAVGNTVAGLYVLVPGAYLVTSLYSTTIDGSFFSDIIIRAIIIGIGGWTGTILCSPTLLGTTRGLMWQQPGKNKSNDLRHGPSSGSDRRQHRRQETAQAVTMLYF